MPPRSRPPRRPTTEARKIKLSVTLDAHPVRDLRRRVGARGVSAAVNQALHHELARLDRDDALDAWLAELDVEDGPIPADAIDRWEQIWQDVDESRSA